MRARPWVHPSALLAALAGLLLAGCGAPAENAAFSSAQPQVDREAAEPPAAPAGDTGSRGPAPAPLPPSPLVRALPTRGTLLILGPAQLLPPRPLKSFVDAKQDAGWKVVVQPLKSAPTEAEVLQSIHATFDAALDQATDDHPAGHVLIVGDAPGGKPGLTAAGRVPCNTRTSTFLGALATDFEYTLPTATRLPRLSVGRVPARTADEFADFAQRVLNVEQAAPAEQTALRNRLHFIAGSPGYSPALDKLIENFAFTILTAQVPPELDLRVLYTAKDSDYSTGALPTDRAEAEDLIEAGAFATVVCSHGTITAISGRARERLLENEHVQKLAGRASRTHLFIFTCSSGNFANAPERSPYDGRLINNPEKPDEQSLAEVAVLNPHGPLCVVASSSFSHPLFNKYYCDLLIAVVLKQNPADWGEAWYRIERRFATYRDEQLELMLKDVEPLGDLDTAAADHSYMYNFLGDPTLSLVPLSLGGRVYGDRRPDPPPPGQADSDSGSVRIYGRSQEIREGVAEVEVIVTRADIAKQRPKFKDGETPAEHSRTAVERYRLTTDKTLAAATVQIHDGEYSQVFHLAGTDWLRAKQVRVLLRGRDGRTAAGIADLVAAPPAPGPAPAPASTPEARP